MKEEANMTPVQSYLADRFKMDEKTRKDFLCYILSARSYEAYLGRICKDQTEFVELPIPVREKLYPLGVICFGFIWATNFEEVGKNRVAEHFNSKLPADICWGDVDKGWRNIFKTITDDQDALKFIKSMDEDVF